MIGPADHQTSHDIGLVDGRVGVLIRVVIDRMRVIAIGPVISIMAGESAAEVVVGA